MEFLREMVRDAVQCHFPDEQNCPRVSVRRKDAQESDRF
jgi:hypothetical protein